jgi:hypothetical protein
MVRSLQLFSMHVKFLSSQSSLRNALMPLNGHLHALSMTSRKPEKDGQNDQNMNLFLPMIADSVFNNNCVWSEQSDDREISSCPGKRASHFVEMKTLSIFSNVRCDLSLLQVNNLPSRCTSFTMASSMK